MKGWIAGGLKEWKEYSKLYSKFLDEQQRAMHEAGVPTHGPGGYETEAYKRAKARAKEQAKQEFGEQKKVGAFKGFYPEIEGEPWADVAKRIKEHWLEPYEDAKERIGRMLKAIVEIEKKAAAEIGAAVPRGLRRQERIWAPSWAAR
ncbi:MAG: hypothetical protein ACYST6_21345 [Planctomycetota bacterium]|jgi:hypothetical protein